MRGNPQFKIGKPEWYYAAQPDKPWAPVKSDPRLPMP
jgi:hypothetical protein